MGQRQRLLGVLQGEGEDPIVDVDDRLDGKGTGGKRISWMLLKRRETVDGWGKRGLEWKWRENNYGWELIFSGEEGGGLVVEGNYIFFHDRGSVFSQWARLGWVLIIFHQMKNCLCMRNLYLLVIC